MLLCGQCGPSLNSAREIAQISLPHAQSYLPSNTPDKVNRYRLEPYVVAADIHSTPPHAGHGGWNWYTGSASWMYLLGEEAMLGLQRKGNRLQINPCIPKNWKEYELTYRHSDTSYPIRVESPNGVNQGVKQVRLDGRYLPKKKIYLLNDRQERYVSILMG